jgi:hypothetical protein
MEGIEKPLTEKYKGITNNWNYDASCTLTSLPVWDLENFKPLIFVVQSVQVLQSKYHCIANNATLVRGKFMRM